MQENSVFVKCFAFLCFFFPFDRQCLASVVVAVVVVRTCHLLPLNSTQSCSDAEVNSLLLPCSFVMLLCRYLKSLIIIVCFLKLYFTFTFLFCFYFLVVAGALDCRVLAGIIIVMR